MKLKWNGFDLELTVEELKQMVEMGLIDHDDEKALLNDPEDDKVPYPDTWKELLKMIPKPAQPSDPLKPYVNPQSPFPFPTVTAYGCESVQGPLGGVAQWDGTMALDALDGKLTITDNGEVARRDSDNTGNPGCSKK